MDVNKAVPPLNHLRLKRKRSGDEKKSKRSTTTSHVATAKEISMKGRGERGERAIKWDEQDEGGQRVSNGHLSTKRGGRGVDGSRRWEKNALKRRGNSWGKSGAKPSTRTRPMAGRCKKTGNNTSRLQGGLQMAR